MTSCCGLYWEVVSDGFNCAVKPLVKSATNNICAAGLGCPSDSSSDAPTVARWLAGWHTVNVPTGRAPLRNGLYKNRIASSRQTAIRQARVSLSADFIWKWLIAAERYTSTLNLIAAPGQEDASKCSPKTARLKGGDGDHRQGSDEPRVGSSTEVQTLPVSTFVFTSELRCREFCMTPFSASLAISTSSSPLAGTGAKPAPRPCRTSKPRTQ